MSLWWPSFQQSLQELGLNADERWKNSLSIYVQELLEWNKTTNLTGITEEGRVGTTLLADSLSCLKSTRLGSGALKVLDVGTGAGIPAIPLAAVRPTWRMGMLEATRKKCDFLKHVVQKMNIPAEVWWGRAEDFGQDKIHREHYDLVFSRAVAALSTNLELAVPFLKKDGLFVTYKSDPMEEELESSSAAQKILGAELVEKISYQFTQENAKRKWALIFQKTHSTPGDYPRRAGLPSKKPLL